MFMQSFSNYSHATHTSRFDKTAQNGSCTLRLLQGYVQLTYGRLCVLYKWVLEVYLAQKLQTGLLFRYRYLQQTIFHFLANTYGVRLMQCV